MSDSSAVSCCFCNGTQSNRAVPDSGPDILQVCFDCPRAEPRHWKPQQSLCFNLSAAAASRASCHVVRLVGVVGTAAQFCSALTAIVAHLPRRPCCRRGPAPWASARAGADGISALDDPKPVDVFVTAPLRSAAGRPDARSGTRGTLRPQLIGPVSVNTTGEVNHRGQGAKPHGSCDVQPRQAPCPFGSA